MTCLGALQSAAIGTPDQPINNSTGCGGVMRVAPLGLMPSLLGAEQAFDLAVRATASTHGRPSGYLSAGALAAMLHALIANQGLEKAASLAINAGIECSKWPKS
jgi:ADP-ribosylglycohydrolase